MKLPSLLSHCCIGQQSKFASLPNKFSDCAPARTLAPAMAADQRGAGVRRGKCLSSRQLLYDETSQPFPFEAEDSNPRRRAGSSEIFRWDSRDENILPPSTDHLACVHARRPDCPRAERTGP